jgi:uncharacterized protein
MLLIERINQDIAAAMKAKESDKLMTLRVLKGELQRSDAKSDNDVITQVGKMVNNIKDTTPNSGEVDILEVYLPKTLSDEEIQNLVKEQIEMSGYSSPKDMKHLMNYFKDNFNGQYDGKTLSLIVREELNK